MSNARTDIHRPAALVTEDYEFEFCYDAHPEEGTEPRVRMQLINALVEQGWRFGGNYGTQQCDHCGQRIRYIAVLKHLPTHSLITVGEQCLDNRFSLASGEFHTLRKAAKLNRERKVMREVRAEWAADHQDVIDFLNGKAEEAEARFGFVPDRYDLEMQDFGYFNFVCSLYAQMQSKGTLSEGQVEAVRRNAVKDAARQAERAAKDAERTEDCPTGKVAVTGTIRKIDVAVNDFGSREVMTVETDGGVRLWGTQPRALYDAKVGDRVSFTATIEPKDPSFGYFKRPSKATIL